MQPECTACVANTYLASSLQEAYKTGGATLKFDSIPVFAALDDTPEPAYLPYPTVPTAWGLTRNWIGPVSKRPSYHEHGGVGMRPAVFTRFGQYLNSGNTKFRYGSGGGLTFSANVKFDGFSYKTHGIQKQMILGMNTNRGGGAIQTYFYLESGVELDSNIKFRFEVGNTACTLSVPVDPSDLEWKFVVGTFVTHTGTMALSVNGVNTSMHCGLPSTWGGTFPMEDVELQNMMIGRGYGENRMFEQCGDNNMPVDFCPARSSIGGAWLNAAISGLFVVDQVMDADTIAAHIDPQTGQLYNHGHAVCVSCPANSVSPAQSTHASDCTCRTDWRNKNEGIPMSAMVCVPV